jgi:hypothetical protein
MMGRLYEQLTPYEDDDYQLVMLYQVSEDNRTTDK